MGNFCSGGEESKKAGAFQASNDSGALQVADANSSAALSAAMDGGLFDSSHTPSSLQPQKSLQQSSSQPASSADTSQLQQQQQLQQQKQQQDNQAQLKLREEQNRLDLIVQMAGRGMVSVRSTRGSTGYYDQGFAAALGQHLEQTTRFPDQLPIRLPPHTTTTSTTTTSQTKSTNNKTDNSKNNNNKDATSNGDTAAAGSSTPTSANNNAVFQRLSQPQWDNIALGTKGVGLAGCDGENPNTYMDHLAVSFLDSVVPKKERIFHGGVGPMVENLL